LNDTKQAKAYLWRVRDAERELKRLEEEYEQAKADILHLKTMEYDKDKVSNPRIGDLPYRDVLVRRYLQGQSFEQVAVGMGFDYRWTRRLHGRALCEFQKLTLESPIRSVI